MLMINDENEKRDLTGDEFPGERERLLSAIIDASHDAILTKTLDGIITGMNPAAERLYGYSAQDVIGKHISIFVPDDRREEVGEILESLSRGEKVEKLETVRVNKKGDFIPVTLTVSPVISSSGKILGGFAITHDETTRKTLENEIQEFLNQLKNFKFALEASAIVAITDKSGRIIYVNEKFCEISKYSRQELLGQDHRIINSGYHPKEFFRQLWQTIASGKVWHGEIRNRAKDGSIYWVDTTIVPFLDESGKPRQYIAVRYDITGHKVMELTLGKQARELKRSNADLEQFAYIASHDLQEPLRTVARFTELLAERYRGRLDEKADMYIDFAVDGAKRMHQLVQDLLNYSLLEKHGEELKTVDSGAVIERVIKGHRSTVEKIGAEINCGEMPFVKADETQLGQVFQNLISNALKFRSDRQTVININSEEKKDECIFSVEDNGIGIMKEQAGLVFQIFQRLHDRDKYGGNGIGLATAKKIVERHGGKIWFESELDKGTKFFFTLPVIVGGDTI
ncbi:MAG: PAS domain S-box protein [Pyrinomonadaceae bacterium]